MINPKLLAPKSIVVCGASSDIHKPDGKVLKNLKESGFKGQIYAVNPKETEVQGVRCYAKVEDLPQVDCAILAIAAKYCPPTVDVLAHQKGTGGFIIVSAGFRRRTRQVRNWRDRLWSTSTASVAPSSAPTAPDF